MAALFKSFFLIFQGKKKYFLEQKPDKERFMYFWQGF